MSQTWKQICESSIGKTWNNMCFPTQRIFDSLWIFLALNHILDGKFHLKYYIFELYLIEIRKNGYGNELQDLTQNGQGPYIVLLDEAETKPSLNLSLYPDWVK